jgi:amino acid transporter
MSSSTASCTRSKAPQTCGSGSAPQPLTCRSLGRRCWHLFFSLIIVIIIVIIIIVIIIIIIIIVIIVTFTVTIIVVIIIIVIIVTIITIILAQQVSSGKGATFIGLKFVNGYSSIPEREKKYGMVHVAGVCV